jgi:hypothetical protein
VVEEAAVAVMPALVPVTAAAEEDPALTSAAMPEAALRLIVPLKAIRAAAIPAVVRAYVSKGEPTFKAVVTCK